MESNSEKGENLFTNGEIQNANTPNVLDCQDDNEDNESLISVILLDENDFHDLKPLGEKKLAEEEDEDLFIIECKYDDDNASSQDTVEMNGGICQEEIIIIKKKLEPKKRKIHICSHCQKAFKSEKCMNRHVDVNHLGKLPYICEKCGLFFRTTKLLNRHIFHHSNELLFPCDVCDKSFKTKLRLKLHKDVHEDTKYVCPECGRVLNTKRTYNLHRKTHTNKNQKKYKCEYCGSSFVAMKGLKNHLVMHTGMKPYFCNFCDRRFSYGSSLRSHKKDAHALELAELERKGEIIEFKPNIPSLEKLLAFSRAAAKGEVKAVRSQRRVFYRYNQNYKPSDKDS